MGGSTTESERCVCGHSRAAHDHLRRGTDCSLCVQHCTRFRRRGARRHVLDLMLQALHRGHEA